MQVVTDEQAERNLRDAARAKCRELLAKLDELLVPGGVADRLTAFEEDEAGVLARLEAKHAEDAAWPALRKHFKQDLMDYDDRIAQKREELAAIERGIAVRRGRLERGE